MSAAWDLKVTINPYMNNGTWGRLYLATKLANPHYRPEIAAQTTLVNFCVTEEGLEEQLLAAVVDHERADLQEAAAALVAQLGQYTITLTELENNLLARLANSQAWAGACTSSILHGSAMPDSVCHDTPSARYAGRHPGGHRADREPGGDQAHRAGDRRQGGAGQGDGHEPVAGSRGARAAPRAQAGGLTRA